MFWGGTAWAPIPSMPGYYASRDGRILSTARGGPREKKQRLFKKGYLIISYKSQIRLVHRLILEAHVGPCPDGQECRHLDGDPAHNHLGNLRWGTPSENVHDKGRHGRFPRGENSGHHKLTEAEVLNLRELRAQGWILADLGRRFGISKAHASRIVRRENWSHI